MKKKIRPLSEKEIKSVSGGGNHINIPFYLGPINVFKPRKMRRGAYGMGGD